MSLLAARTRVHLAGQSGHALCGVRRCHPQLSGDATCPDCLRKLRNGPVVYLIHFDRPYQHARHYVGWTENLTYRLAHHRAGSGSRLLAVVNEAGIGWDVTRVWPGASRTFERQVKAHSAGRWCPLCTTRPRCERRTVGA